MTTLQERTPEAGGNSLTNGRLHDRMPHHSCFSPTERAESFGTNSFGTNFWDNVKGLVPAHFVGHPGDEACSFPVF